MPRFARSEFLGFFECPRKLERVSGEGSRLPQKAARGDGSVPSKQDSQKKIRKHPKKMQGPPNGWTLQGTACYVSNLYSTQGTNPSLANVTDGLES